MHTDHRRFEDNYGNAQQRKYPPDVSSANLQILPALQFLQHCLPSTAWSGTWVCDSQLQPTALPFCSQKLIRDATMHAVVSLWIDRVRSKS